jgi:hypothetical protein
VNQRQFVTEIADEEFMVTDDGCQVARGTTIYYPNQPWGDGWEMVGDAARGPNGWPRTLCWRRKPQGGRA